MIPLPTLLALGALFAIPGFVAGVAVGIRWKRRPAAKSPKERDDD